MYNMQPSVNLDWDANARGTFVDSLHKVSFQVNPDLIPKEESLLFIESLLFKLVSRLLASAPRNVYELEDRASKVFKVDKVDKAAIKAAQSSLKECGVDLSNVESILQTNGHRKKILNLNASTLNFAPVIERVHALLLKDVLSYRVDQVLALYLVALLEYVSIDIFRLTGNYVKNMRHKEIKLEDVKIAMNADKILMELFYEDEDDDDEEEERGEDEEDEDEEENEEESYEDKSYLDVVKDIVYEERNLINNLAIIIKIFRDPYKDVDESILDVVFSNICDVNECCLNFLGLIEDSLEMNPEKELNIGWCFEEILESQELDVFEKFSSDIITQKDENLQGIQKLASIPPRAPFSSTSIFTSATYPFLVKYVLPQMLKEVVFHALYYYEYIKILKGLGNNEEDREAFEQSEGLIKRLNKEIEKKLKESEKELERNKLFYLRKKRKKEKEKRRKKRNILQRIDGLTNTTRNLLMNSELVAEGSLIKVRKNDATVVIRKMTPFHYSERLAFLFESSLILVKEDTSNATSSLNNNTTQHTTGNSNLAMMSSMSTDEEAIMSNSMTTLDDEMEQTTDECSHQVTASHQNRQQYKLKEKFKIRNIEIFENDTLENCFEIKSGGLSSTILMAKNDEEKRRWFAKILFTCSKSTIERYMNTVVAEEEKRNPLKLPSPSEYVFAEKDSPENIVFESSSKSVIKGATITKLVERLTFHSTPDPMFIKIFLVTYRSFVSPVALLDLLKKRYSIPVVGDSREEIKRFKKEYMEPVQFRVLNVIRHWIDAYYFDDFKNDPELQSSVIAFLESIVNRNLRKWVESILQIIKRKEESGEEGRKTQVLTERPPPIEWHLAKDILKFNLMTLHPLEFGRQITLYEFELYCSVKPFELIGLKWTKEDKEKEAVNLMRMIKHSTNFTYYLAKEIVETPNFEERVALVSRIIEVLQVLQDLNNFNGILEIISALNLSCIFRLEHTMSSLTQKHKRIIEEMQELNSAHYKKYQEKLRSINPPCVPFFGIYLTNILHLEEGNSDFIESHQLINFSKRRKIAEITTEIQQYQNQPYCLTMEPTIRQFIATLDPIGSTDQKLFEDYLYEKSLSIEPRGLSKPPKGGPKRWPDISLKSPGIKPSSSSKPSSLTFSQPIETVSPLISPKTPPNTTANTTVCSTSVGSDSVFVNILIPLTPSAVPATPSTVSTPPPLPPRTTNTLSRAHHHQRTMSESSSRSHPSPSSPSTTFSFNFAFPPPPPPRKPHHFQQNDSEPPPLPPRGISPGTLSRHHSILSQSPRRNSSSLSPPPFPQARRLSSQPSLPPRTYRQTNK